MGVSGEVGEEDKAGGKGTVVHGFIGMSKGTIDECGRLIALSLMSFKPWCILCFECSATRMQKSPVKVISRFEILHVTYKNGLASMS